MSAGCYNRNDQLDRWFIWLSRRRKCNIVKRGALVRI